MILVHVLLMIYLDKNMPLFGKCISYTNNILELISLIDSFSIINRILIIKENEQGFDTSVFWN